MFSIVEHFAMLVRSYGQYYLALDGYHLQNVLVNVDHVKTFNEILNSHSFINFEKCNKTSLFQKQKKCALLLSSSCSNDIF